MNYSFTKEQCEIIEKDFEDFLIDKGKFLHFLRERGEILNFRNEIYPDISFSEELKHGEIGIKSHNINLIDSKLKKIAVIKMMLYINKRLVDDWISREMKENLIQAFRIFPEMVRFSNQIEQFILRGLDTRIPFKVSELNGDENFESFFCSFNKIPSIKVDKSGGFHEAAQILKSNLKKANFFPPFTLLSDSKTKSMAEIGPHYFEVSRKTEKRNIEESNDISKWIDLVNADNSNDEDHKLICIPNREKYGETFRVLENDLKIFFTYNRRIVLYWCGALEIIDKNAIQRIKIIF